MFENRKNLYCPPRWAIKDTIIVTNAAYTNLVLGLKNPVQPALHDTSLSIAPNVKNKTTKFVSDNKMLLWLEECNTKRKYLNFNN